MHPLKLGEMNRLKEFDIHFIGLKPGTHRYSFSLDKMFFDQFEFEDYNNAQLQAEVVLHKGSNHLDLDFAVRGTVNVNCDLSDEPFDLPIEGTFHQVVNFGDVFDDSNDEILILPHGENNLNVAQQVYELTVLSTPMKRVHPGVTDGTISPDILKRINSLNQIQKPEYPDNDPRWDELKKLITKHDNNNGTS